MDKSAPARPLAPAPVFAIFADGDFDQLAYSRRDLDRESRDLRGMGFRVTSRQFASETAFWDWRDSRAGK